MSCFLTQAQVLNRTKTVTRRTRWLDLQPRTILRLVVKGQGLKKGERQQVIGWAEVVSVTREELRLCTDADAAREGFPGLTGQEFVTMFCRHMGTSPETIVTRIEWKYLEGPPNETQKLARRNRSSSGARSAPRAGAGKRVAGNHVRGERAAV